MKKRIYQLTFLLIMMLLGCNGLSKKDPILLEAFEIHKKSVGIAAKSFDIWEKLPANDTMRSKFESELKDWGHNLVEVPGFHYHHDGLGHHHNRTPLKIPPDDMLLVQKEFKDSIESIHQRILRYEAGQRKQ